MARLRDVPVVIRRIGIWEFVKRLWNQTNKDNVLVWAAALSYSWLFALFPFIIFLLTLVPLLPADRKEFARKELAEFVYENLPRDAADTLWINLTPRLEQILDAPPKGLLGVGLFFALWAASGGVAMTISAMNKCYDVETERVYWKGRLLAIALTVVLVILMLLIMILLPIGTLVTNLTVKWLAAHQVDVFSSPLLVAWQFARYSLALVLMFAALHCIYHYGPNLKQKMTLVTPGAVFCIGVWFLLGMGFRYYVDNFGQYSEMYGAIGGVVILLFLFYIDAAVLLIGGEINSEIDYEILKIPGEETDLKEVPPAHAAEVAPDKNVERAPLPPMSKFNLPPPQ